MSKEDQRRVIKVLSGAFGLTIAVTGLIFLWMGRDGIMDMITEKKTAYSALEVDLDELHVGDHVTVDTSIAMDYVLQRTETGRRKGYISSQVTWRYYLIPVIKEDGQYIHMDHMVLVSTRENFNKIDEAKDAFLSWWNSADIDMETLPSETVLSVDGRVAKLTNKELRYLKDYFGDEDYREYVAPYVIKPLWDKWDKETQIDSFYIGVGSLVAGLVLLIFAFLYGRTKGTKKNAVTGVAGQGIPVTQAAGQVWTAGQVRPAGQVGPAGQARPTGQVGPAARTVQATAFADLSNNPRELKKYMEGEVRKLTAEQKAELLNLIGSGQTIQAMKVFREITGVGLRYAKEAIDHYDIYLK